MTLIPAYGRDYKNKAAVLADWNAGKDFQIVSIGPYMGSYCSNRDNLGPVTIRYNKQRDILAIGESA